MAEVVVCSRSFSNHPVLRQELLARYPDTKFNDAGKSLAGDDLIDFIGDAPKAIIALEVLDADTVARLPNLKVIGKYGVGLDKIDFEALKKAGIRMGWTAGVNKRSVSELVIAMAISMLRLVPYAADEIKARRWRQHVGRQLSDQTVGIVGCGHVGKDLVTLLKPFGCRIVAHDIVDFPEFYAEHGVTALPLDELLATSDVISLHVPLDRSTRHMINAGKFALMKQDAVLINCARGGIVDERALATALREGPLAAAAFDVFDVEPMYDDILLALPNFLATPHIGGSAAEAILAMGRAAIDGLDHAVDADTYI
ncbi:MAG: phosphoglycerate dehydrogenase [Alphaproteobacteria bacterium]|nr:MAG: phosphoglycerate dehydrogenase [Alphaproteobacteria bacterium]